MAERESLTALIPADPIGYPETPARSSSYQIVVKDMSATGKVQEMSFPLPSSADFQVWSIEQQVGMLKRGMWNKLSIPDILWGLAYAHHIGADPMIGDIFPTGEGRWGTSNKYKIRRALETGRIEGIETDIVDLGTELRLEKCIQKTDLECIVTVTVKGFTKPIVRKAKLSRWYKANNPNWQGNPEHMLELNTVAHALEYVIPGATEDDETPAVVAINEAQELIKQLKETK